MTGLAMRRTLPPLAWFRSFEAAARTLNFTAAADEIGLTQSAVSQQIKGLETRLNVSLFLRRPRGLALTDEGRKLLPQVESALRTLAAATAGLEIDPGTRHLTVAASISVVEWVIAPRLQAFRALYPDVVIRFLSTIWPDEFAVRRADVEVRFGSEKQVGQGAVAVGSDRLVAVKAPHLEGHVRDLPLIEMVGTSVGWDAWTQEAVEGPLKGTLFADSYGLALRLTEQGNGVALISEGITSHSFATGRIVRAHDTTIVGKERYFLSINQDVQAAVDFGAWLKDVLAR